MKLSTTGDRQQYYNIISLYRDLPTVFTWFKCSTSTSFSVVQPLKSLLFYKSFSRHWGSIPILEGPPPPPPPNHLFYFNWAKTHRNQSQQIFDFPWRKSSVLEENYNRYYYHQTHCTICLHGLRFLGQTRNPSCQTLVRSQFHMRCHAFGHKKQAVFSLVHGHVGWPYWTRMLRYNLKHSFDLLMR